MKILMIGGTGTISMTITRLLAERGEDVILLNRGTRTAELPAGVKTITADINNEAETAAKLEGMSFDAVCEFIGFVPEQLERDWRLFHGRTGQFIYISSASAYQKPLSDYLITESTPLANPCWAYSRNKIACEELLMKHYREDGFPVTIVRPSHTFDERSVPVGVHGANGSWQVIKRMLEGKPIIVHGDGSSLWTMTFNRDFAPAYAGLIGNVHAIGESYHITSDESLTWNQIYSAIASALGVSYKPYYVPSDFLDAVSDQDYRGGLLGDKSNTVVFDNSKIKRAVPGWHTKYRFDQAIRIVVDHVLNHPGCQKDDPAFDAWCDEVIAAMEAAKAVLQAKI